MIKLIACGNLTNDPVLNEREYVNPTTGEVVKTHVCNFSIAANEGFGDRKTTVYFRVSAWRGLANVCKQYLTKGRAVLVSGPVKQNNYVDKTGTIRSGMEIRADEIQFIGAGPKTTIEMPEEEPELSPEDVLPY